MKGLNTIAEILDKQPQPNFDIKAVQTSMNYELPDAIVQQANVGLAVYWSHVRNAHF